MEGLFITHKPNAMTGFLLETLIAILIFSIVYLTATKQALQKENKWLNRVVKDYETEDLRREEGTEFDEEEIKMYRRIITVYETREQDKDKKE